MTRDDTGRAFWPAHLPGTKARLSAGHGTGQNPAGSRPKARPTDRKHDDALRAAADRGVQLSPSQRMALGYADADRAHTDDQES